MKKTLYILFFCFLITNIFAQNGTMPLSGKRILITAPDIYASRLAASLYIYGAEVVSMPSIETIVYDSLPEINLLLDKGVTFKYIVLPSRNAIKAFHNYLKTRDDSLFYKSDNYAVIGKDIEFLHSVGLNSDMTLKEQSMEGIAKAIEEKGGFSEAGVLLIAPLVSEIKEPDVVPDFQKRINALGAECFRIDGYTTRLINPNKYTEILNDIKAGKFDMIAFSSAGEVYALLEMLKKRELNSALACFGPYTAANAKKRGIKIDMVSEKYSSFDDFAESICKYFNK